MINDAECNFTSDISHMRTHTKMMLKLFYLSKKIARKKAFRLFWRKPLNALIITESKWPTRMAKLSHLWSQSVKRWQIFLCFRENFLGSFDPLFEGERKENEFPRHWFAKRRAFSPSARKWEKSFLLFTCFAASTFLTCVYVWQVALLKWRDVFLKRSGLFLRRVSSLLRSTCGQPTKICELIFVSATWTRKKDIVSPLWKLK